MSVPVGDYKSTGTRITVHSSGYYVEMFCGLTGSNIHTRAEHKASVTVPYTIQVCTLIPDRYAGGAQATGAVVDGWMRKGAKEVPNRIAEAHTSRKSLNAAASETSRSRDITICIDCTI